MATITELQNNITGLSFRTTLNNNYANLNNDKVELTAFNTALDRVDTAEANITSIQSWIDTHESEINALADRITVNEGLLDFEYATVSNVVIGDSTYVEVINNTFALTNGLYKIDMSTMFNMDVLNYDAFFRFSLDNGVTWREVRSQIIDLAESKALSYSFMYPVTNNTLNIQIQSKIENAAYNLTIEDLQVMIDRKA